MSHTLHLPSIYNEFAAIEGMSPNAATFADAWMQALGERAFLMRVDERLVRAAELHAAYLDSRTEQEIAERDHIPHASHYGRDWSTANERVRRAGYALPDYYPKQGNNVESNARNLDPIDALNRLLDSEFHGPHLRGEGGYARQVYWGCGNVGDDYVALTAPEPVSA